MEICKICDRHFKNKHGLSAHVFGCHEISKKEYYDKYIKTENEGVCEKCGKETTFRDNRYLRFCSNKCYTSSKFFSEQSKKNASGKTQSKETIEKRIKNTDQSTKQKNREKTLLEKYNDIKYNNSEKIGLSNKGKKVIRTKEHQEKIIESKIKNNTIKHTEETKRKISKGVNKVYNSENPPVTISEQKYLGRGHKTGYLNGIYYRSSYELKFLEYCFSNSINVKSAENKEFRVPYFYNEKRHWYYPDFYLEKYDIVVEIKPNSLLTDEKILCKIHEGMLHHNLIILDEEYLDKLDEIFLGLENEYLLSAP